MPILKPIKRTKLIQYLRKTGFKGPLSGGKHQFMFKGTLNLRIPNPHASEIGKNLLTRILKQAEISIKEWEEL
jgi:predicted RNA binding protein YcfA (HicA-like mRNA interferase family)